MEVVYSLRGDNSLVIDYVATTDKTTVLNITNHTYFNLSGNPAQTILDHEIQIHADAFTPVDSNLIPTGELKAVKGDAFDFTSFKSIGKEIDGDDPQLVFGKGYDHNFVLNKIPIVDTSICKCEGSFSVFLTLVVHSFILCSIWPGFYTFSMLLIILPFAYISCSISVSIASIAMSFIVLPLSFIYVSIGMN